MKEEFKLTGLNKKKEGIYATVECGSEDWFHSDFDEKLISIERQESLFKMFKYSEESLWEAGRHTVTVEFDGWSTGHSPINPIIVGLNLIL